MKKLSKFLVILLAFFALFTVAACKQEEEKKVDYDSILGSYLLTNDGKTVSKDFTLPKTLEYGEASYEITWTSSDPCVTITARDEDYLAAVSYPDKATTVTLTLELAGHTKTFTVMVSPLDVYSFSDNYAFTKDKATVTESFDLDTEYTYKGKKATITWTVDEEYADYLEISADGKKCIVYPSSLNPTVKIKATFAYNGEETTKQYRMTVSLPMSHEEEVDNWYNVVGTSIDISGYVLVIGEPYSESYGNINVYVLDDDLQTGYYLYRVSADAANGAAVTPGCHVTVTGAISYNYKGLVEASATGTLVVDKDVKAINPADYVYAFDNDLLGDVPAAVYKESRIVSLTNWEVTSVNATHSESSPTTILKLKKGDVEIAINYTKYVKSAYTYSTDDATVSAILAKVAAINEGDYVSVQGILGSYNAYQITVLSADDIKTGSKDDEGTVYAGEKVGAVIEENAKLIKEAFSNIVVSNKEVNLVNAKDDVTVEFKLCSSSQAVTIDGGKFTIAPTTKQEKVNVQATYKYGDYETVVFFKVQSLKMSDEDMAKAEAEAYAIEDVKAGTYELATNGETFESVTFTFEVVDAESAKLVTVDGANITLLPVDENTAVKINVIAHQGEASYTQEVTFNILPTSFTKIAEATSVEVGKAYKFGYYQINKSEYYYALGTSASGYGSTTDNMNEAPDFYVEEVEGGYKLYTTVDSAKVYFNVTASGDYNNVGFDETGAVLTWNAEHNTFTFTVNGHTTATKDGVYYCGTYSTYTTMSVSLADTYLPTCDVEGATSCCTKLYEIVVDNTTTEGRAQKEADQVKFDLLKKGDEVTLTTEPKYYNDVTISYALKADYSFVTLADNKITVTEDGESVQEFVVVVTAKCGLATVTKEITVQVDAATVEGLSCDEVYKKGADAYVEGQKATLPGYYVVSGIVCKKDKYNNLYISQDGTTSNVIECYKLTPETVNVGDYVTVKGKLVNFKGTVELDSGCTLEAHYAYKSLADIVTLGNALENKATSTENYFSCGIITSVLTSYTPGAVTFWMSDGTNNVEVYSTPLAANVSASDVKVGAKAYVVGPIQKYNTTIEFTAAGNVVDVVADQSATVSTIQEIKFADFKEAGEVELVQTVKFGYITVKFEYEVLEGTATISEGKLIVNELPAAAETLKIKVTATAVNPIDEIAAAYLADYMTVNTLTDKDIEVFDTAGGESSWMAAMLSDETMNAKWAWLYKIIAEVAENADMATPTAENAATLKGSFLANIYGLFHGEQHKDTYLSTDSADWSKAENVAKVTNKYVIDAIAADYLADFLTVNDKTGYDLSVFDTNVCSSDWMTAMLSNETMNAKWAWLYQGFASVTGNADMAAPTAENANTLKGLFLANIYGLFHGEQHKDTWLEKDSADWSKAENVTKVLAYGAENFDYSVELKADVAAAVVLPQYVLTAKSLLGYTDTNVAYADGVEHEVDGATFVTTQAGAFGSGIQLKKTTACIYNKTELKGAVNSIELELYAKKTVYNNTGAFKFSFSNNADFTDAEEILIDTVADQYTGYIVTPTKSYKYVKMSVCLGFTFYVEKITINYDAPVEYKLTAKSLLGYTDTNVAYADNAEHEVDGATFVTTQIGCYGSGLQYKKSLGVVWNKTELKGSVTSIDIEIQEKKATADKADAFKFEFSNNADFTDAETILLSIVADQYNYTVTPTKAYKYFRMTNNVSSAMYVKEITIHAAKVEEPDPVTYDNKLTITCFGFGSGDTTPDTNYFHTAAQPINLWLVDKATALASGDSYIYANKVGISYDAEKGCYVVKEVLGGVHINTCTADYVLFWNDSYENKAIADLLKVVDTEIHTKADFASATAGVVAFEIEFNAKTN